jgi:hypothetical protein
MLTFPEVFTLDGVAVLPDDEDCNLFYLLPGRPRLRQDDGGRPVFRALFWTEDGSGSTLPSVAGLRGALLHFDVNLAVPAAVQDRIREQIQSSGVQARRAAEIERDEKERIARMARATGADAGTLPRPRVPEIGEPRFGSVQFTGGQVELLEEKDGQFVAWSSAGGPPSLIGDNNSAFALRLGPEGAAVWYRALEQDASAIGVRYQLKFQARLPSLQIHVWAGSHQKLELERKAERVITNMDQGCSDADVERIDVKEVSEKLTEEGLVNIEIIKGTAKISDEQVSQLRNSALGLISDRVKEILTHKIQGMTPEERRSSLLQKVTEEVTSFAELRLTQRDVIDWQVNPQATITDFLGGLTGDARKRLITLVDLSDPVVSNVEARVSANASWDGEPGVSRVIVKVEYPAAREDPRAVQEFSFDKGDSAPKTFRCRRVRRDQGQLRYSARAYVRGSSVPIDLRADGTNGQVHVEVPDLGCIKLKLRPHPDIFGSTGGTGKITAIDVAYEYNDVGAPDHLSDRAVVRPADVQSGVAVAKLTFRQVDQPVRFRPTYLRDGAPAIVGKEQQIWVQAGREATVEIPEPWTDHLEVKARVLPVKGLKRVTVDVRYEDGSFQSDRTMALEADSGDDQEGLAWSGRVLLPQLDLTRQRFRYRYSVEGPDQLVVGPWIEAEGDQELIPPVLAVKLRADRLRLGTDYTEALVRLTYRDPTRRFETSHEFFLTRENAAQQVWLVPRSDPTLDSYRCSVTLFKPSGEPVDVPEREARGENLILIPPV